MTISIQFHFFQFTFFKTINAAVTYNNIITVFNGKANRANKHSNLGFILQFASTIGEIRDKFQLGITKLDYSGYSINSIIDQIDTISGQICVDIGVDEHEGDSNFNAYYQNFYSSRDDNYYAQRVKDVFSDMKKEHKDLKDRFDVEILMVNRLKALIERDIDHVNENGGLGSYASQITTRLNNLKANYEEIKRVFESYNSSRARWVEYMIGMRDGLNSPRRTLRERDARSARHYR